MQKYTLFIENGKQHYAGIFALTVGRALACATSVQAKIALMRTLRESKELQGRASNIPTYHIFMCFHDIKSNNIYLII